MRVLGSRGKSARSRSVKFLLHRLSDFALSNASSVWWLKPCVPGSTQGRLRGRNRGEARAVASRKWVARGTHRGWWGVARAGGRRVVPAEQVLRRSGAAAGDGRLGLARRELAARDDGGDREAGTAHHETERARIGSTEVRGDVPRGCAGQHGERAD